MFASANPATFFHLSRAAGGARERGARVSSARAPRGASPHPLAPGSAAPRTWWTVEELAQDLGVNEKTVRRWIHQGKLTAKRAGKGLRIHRFAVTAMLDREPLGPQLPKRQRGGQLRVLPPPGVRQMYRDRELRDQEQREATRYG